MSVELKKTLIAIEGVAPTAMALIRIQDTLRQVLSNPSQYGLEFAASNLQVMAPWNAKHYRYPTGDHLRHSLVDTYVLNASAVFTAIREAMAVQYARAVVVHGYVTVLDPDLYLTKDEGQYSDFNADALSNIRSALRLDKSPDLLIYDPNHFDVSRIDREQTVALGIEYLETELDVDDLKEKIVRYFKLRQLIGARVAPTTGE